MSHNFSERPVSGLSDSYDFRENRKSVKWSRREQVARVMWTLVLPFFWLSPRPFWRWRVVLLRLFGADIGSQVQICPTVSITMPWNLKIGGGTAVGDRAILYCLGSIVIGSSTTISQGAHLCAGTHDYHRQEMPLVKLPITVGDNVWICAEAFIGPNVTIANHCVVGARAVAMRDIPARCVVVGNPARVVKRLPQI